MQVHYICKICGVHLAAAHASGLEDARLGFAALSGEERARVLSIQGEALTVHTYCDLCAAPGFGSGSTPAGVH